MSFEIPAALHRHHRAQAPRLCASLAIAAVVVLSGPLACCGADSALERGFWQVRNLQWADDTFGANPADGVAGWKYTLDIFTGLNVPAGTALEHHTSCTVLLRLPPGGSSLFVR